MRTKEIVTKLRQAADHEEIVNILRNWTVSELGTTTACVGILVHHLVGSSQIQQAPGKP